MSEIPKAPEPLKDEVDDSKLPPIPDFNIESKAPEAKKEGELPDLSEVTAEKKKKWF